MAREYFNVITNVHQVVSGHLIDIENMRIWLSQNFAGKILGLDKQVNN